MNDVTLHNGCAIIHLTLPDGRRRDAIIDAEDFDRVSQHTWRVEYGRSTYEDAPSAYYVSAKTSRLLGKRRTLLLHRFITGTIDAGRKVHVQHLNEDTFDNRKANLKPGTAFENMQLQRGQLATGVFYDERAKRFSSSIHYAGRRRHLGMFSTHDDAVAIRVLFRDARLADPSDHLPWAEFKAKVLA